MLWLIDPPRGLTGPLPRLDKTPSNLTNRESGVKVIPLLFPSSVRNGLKPAPLGAGNGGRARRLGCNDVAKWSIRR